MARHRAGLQVLGINGAQGSGKSTLAAFLVEHLRQHHSLRALAVSLDDFYLSRTERAKLADTVHPLLMTRGVPGTHDVARGFECLRALRSGRPCRLPVFSKATDDMLTSEHDRQISAAPELVLFEGWCVGTPPQEPAELQNPINELEHDEDADGHWRQYVNRQLAGPYAQWFGELDALVYLRVPGWPYVRAWRAQQEHETAAGHQSRSAFLDDTALERFLLHYQRLTLHALRILPTSADALLELNPQHEVAGLTWRRAKHGQ